MGNKYKNKRMMVRAGNGRFRYATGADFGIGGACPVCRHLLLRHYDGDPKAEFIDPRLFRYRCFTCEPETEAEIATRKAQEEANRQPSIMDVIRGRITEDSDGQRQADNHPG
jgi:hypothetical protein